MKKRHSAGGVVFNAKGEALIVNQNNNSWSLPKGHIEPGETALEAATREIREESGLTELEFVRELGTYERPKIALKGGDDDSEIKVLTFFLFRTSQTKLVPTDPHNPEARWVKKEEVVKYLTHPKDREFFLKTLAELDGKIKL